MTDLFPGIDIKGDGGYVVGAGSLHKSGRQYMALSSIKRSELPPAPQALIDFIRSRAKQTKGKRQIKKGKRNETLYKYSCKLRGEGKEFEEIFLCVANENERRCQPPLKKEEVAKIVESACQHEIGDDHDYGIEDGSFCRWTYQAKSKEWVPRPLCNFSGKIEVEEVIDNGLELKRFFCVSGTRKDGLVFPIAKVPVTQFSSMNSWVLSQWGSKAVISPGQSVNDHLRAAFQHLSPKVLQRRIYAHIGFKKLDNSGWVYLHSKGALTAKGNDASITVQLPEHLASYEFPDTTISPDQVSRDWTQIMALKKLGPSKLFVSLLAIVARAPLSIFLRLDFTVFLVGPTGVFKTELLALGMSFFGRRHDSRNLTGGFESTDGATELTLALARNAAVGIDDFVPMAEMNTNRDINVKFDRVVRSQGNGTSRQRLSPDIEFRTATVSRALPVMTGEDVPGGRSARARTIFVEVNPGEVKVEELTRAQKNASAGVFNRIMGLYIRWLIPQIDNPDVDLGARKNELREMLSESGSHRRTADSIANLMVGWEIFLRFAEENKLIDAPEKAALFAEGLEAMKALVISQQEYLREEEPANRFVDLLRALLLAGRAHLVSAENGQKPNCAYLFGWREERIGLHEAVVSYRPQGDKVGWVNEKFTEVMLDCDLAYAAVQRFAKDQGGSLQFSKSTIWKHLGEKGILIREEGKNVNKRTVEGVRRTVLVMAMEQFIPNKETKGQ